MNEFWHDIPLPTDREKEEAIRQILNTGLTARPGFWQLLGQTWCQAGLRALFFGSADCLFLALLFLVLCLIPAAAAAAQQGPLGPALFLLSPALYASLHLLTAWKEAQWGLEEWRQTCRLSFRAMTALRMLIFGGVSVLACVPANILLWQLAGRQVPLGWMVALSLSSLCLYGTLSLFCLRLKGRAGLLAAPAGWALLGWAALLWEPAARWLAGLPILLFWVLAALSLTLYLVELRRFCLRRAEGGIACALG